LYGALLFHTLHAWFCEYCCTSTSAVLLSTQVPRREQAMATAQSIDMVANSEQLNDRSFLKTPILPQKTLKVDDLPFPWVVC